MKNYLYLSLAASIIIMFTTSCRTVDKRRDITEIRNELDKNEQWRYDLPTVQNDPLRPVFPKVQKAKLDNGLEIFVVEDHRLPIAEVNFVLKNGSATDPLGKAGLMQLTGTMLKEGVKKFSSLELAEEFANLGTEVSVSVGKDMTQVSSGVLSNKIDEVVSLIAQMITEPRMEQQDFDRVKLQHESMLASQQGVQAYVAQTSFLLAAYGDKHPYAYPSGGTVDSVGKISLSDVKACHRNNFGASTGALIVVGDATLKQIVELAKINFDDLKQAAAPVKKIPAPFAKKEMQTRLIGRDEAPQVYLLIGQPIANHHDKDLAKLEVFQSIIAGFPTSRLDANLREGKGWTYGVQSSVSPLRGLGPMLIATSIQVPRGADALGEMLNEFERLKNEPVTDDELSTAKNGILRSFASRYSTIGKIADIITVQFVYSLPEDTDEMLYDKIASVTQKDIMNVAKRALDRQNMTAVAVGDLDTLEIPFGKLKVGKISVEREKKSPTP